MLEEELTNEDFIIADEIFDTLLTNPKKSLELYFKARPAVKKMLGYVNPAESLIEVNPHIDTNKINKYVDAKDNNDIAKHTIYKSCNYETQQEINRIFKNKDD